ncbi:calcium-binding protein P-like [Limulus polyphemus]|uniref:Calcium-binding protein P-like n=1 Tax=Limulus polyphemus TaxID=6850 RepID=A0ABM1T6N6_LIMPO|nr:calcium-binding protein P-like [Limulus polyphemus]
MNTVTPQQQIPQQGLAPRAQYGPQSTISVGQPPQPVAVPYESYQTQQQYSQQQPAGKGSAIVHQPQFQPGAPQYDSTPQPGQAYPPQQYTTSYSPGTSQPPGANPYSRGPQSGYPRPVQAYQQGYQ